MARIRRFHLDLEPVTVSVAGREVSFVGLTFHARSLMLEYDVRPPLHRSDPPFRPALVRIVARDDASAESYPTHWEDFDWEVSRPGRATTRLDRRPPATATELRIAVYDATTDADLPLARFAVALPSGHASTMANG